MKITTKLLLTLLVIMTINQSAQAQNNYTRQKTLPCLDKTFTIVAHIVRDSLGNYGITEGAINERIQELNVYFEPICAKFKVCEFRYIENFRYDEILEGEIGKLDEMVALYHQKNRINVWFVTELDFDPLINIVGVSFGNISKLTSGGIALEKEVGAAVYAHEFGHFFGLLHTFNKTDEPELANGSNCATTGDFICDTPADPYVVGVDLSTYISLDHPCRFIYAGLDENDEYYNPDVSNIMSYYSGCSCSFTHDQYIKMANSYLNSNPKMW